MKQRQKTANRQGAWQRTEVRDTHTIILQETVLWGFHTVIIINSSWQWRIRMRGDYRECGIHVHIRVGVSQRSSLKYIPSVQWMERKETVTFTLEQKTCLAPMEKDCNPLGRTKLGARVIWRYKKSIKLVYRAGRRCEGQARGGFGTGPMQHFVISGPW